MNDLYEYLKKEKLDSQQKIIKKVLNTSINELFEILAKCYIDSLSLEQTLSNAGFFDFAANGTLSGEPYPCADIFHRIFIIKDLVSFCFLYSDTVSIVNPLEFVYGYIKGKRKILSKKDEEYFRKKSVESLLIILELKEAIQYKKISFTKLNYVACTNCLKNIQNIEKKTKDSLFRYAIKSLTPEIIKKINFIFEPPRSIIVQGLGSILSEDQIVLNFINLSNEFKKYSKKGLVKLPEKYKKSYINERIINDAVGAIMMHYGPISLGNTRTFLTNNVLETKLLNFWRGNNEEEKYSHNIIKGLNHLAPFIQGVNPKKLINIRKREEEVFESYRHSIKKVLEETKNSKSQAEFEEALEDIVKPELNKLENVFITKQSDILKKNLIGAAVCLINIGIGLSLNNAETIIAGLTTGTKTSIDCLMEQYKLQKKLAQNNYYFLWKIKQLT